MKELTLQLRDKPARIISRGRSLTIYCDDFHATLKQLQILSLVAQGFTRKQIAQKLGTKPRNVAMGLYHFRRHSRLNRDEQDYHYNNLVKKAIELELVYPVALIGLQELASQLNNGHEPRIK